MCRYLGEMKFVRTTVLDKVLNELDIAEIGRRKWEKYAMSIIFAIISGFEADNTNRMPVQKAACISVHSAL